MMQTFLMGGGLVIAGMLDLGFNPSPRNWLIGVVIFFACWAAIFVYVQRRRKKQD